MKTTEEDLMTFFKAWAREYNLGPQDVEQWLLLYKAFRGGWLKAEEVGVGSPGNRGGS